MKRNWRPYRAAMVALLVAAVVMSGGGLAAAQPSGRSAAGAAPASGAGEPRLPSAAAPVAGADEDTSGLPTLSDDNSDQQDRDAAMTAAAAQAAATGQEVPVPQLTTETEQVVAVPGQGFRLDSDPQPVRAKQGTGWTPVDLTLHTAPDGSLAPAATAYGSVRFSGGGSGPVLTTSSGPVSMAVSWPTTLRAPTVSGDTATYANVLPDVDLVVSATVTGGFSEVLVVKTAAAAHNPALASLQLPVATTGGPLQTAPAGGFQLGASSGAVLQATSAAMWDSNTDLGSTGTDAAAAAASDVFADQSTVEHPGLAARTAQVQVAVAGGGLRITPDPVLLTSSAVVYPLYIDPTANWHPTTGGRPAFEEVKQGAPCNHVSLYNNGGPAGDNGFLGVGVNHWNSCIGIQHAYYQWNLPHVIWGARIHSATVNVVEAYSASCANTSTTVNLHQTRAISAGTTWNNRPGPVAGSINVAVGFLPAANPGHCPNNPARTGGFNVLGAIAASAANHAGQFTAMLSQDANESNGDSALGFKRFTSNPTLQIFYDRAPATPGVAQLSATTGANNAGCATAQPYPFVGKTLASNTTVLNARVSDPDADHLRATFTYWTDPAHKTTALSADSLPSPSTAKVNLAPAFVSALTANQVVSWQAQVSDGALTSGLSPVCHFIAQPVAPAQPTITSADGKNPSTDVPGQEAAVGAEAGTESPFTLTNNGTAASQFVYRLDVPPVLVNPPPDQIAVATNNTGLARVRPLAPGPHTLWVAAQDAAKDASSMAAYRFIAGHTRPSTCASLTACVNNVAISADSNRAAGQMDGTNSYSATDLTGAGWTSGATVTVNGAAFPLPAYGSSQADNVVAAGQTITLNRQLPVHGPNALSFLAATSSAAFGSPQDPAVATAPYVPAGTKTAGVYCFNAADPAAMCTPHGQIHFSDGTLQSYDLLVPDWLTGPTTLATATFGHANTPTASDATKHPRIYAFSVPLLGAGGKTISSVTLPDVNGPDATGRVDGSTNSLHIFSITARNTTSAGLTGDNTWTAGWTSPTEYAYNYEGGTSYQDTTFRTMLRPATRGNSIRLTFDNAFGTMPLTVGAATVAPVDTTVPPGLAGTAPIIAVRFSGAAGTTIPVGGMAYSDPVRITVSQAAWLMVSFTVANPVVLLPQHSWASTAVQWVTAPGAGDHTSDRDTTAFTGTGTISGHFTDVLSGVDVATTGTPSVAVLGDGLVDGSQPNSTASSAFNRLSDGLLGSLTSTPLGYSTVATGINTNYLMKDLPQNHGTASTLPFGGVSALSRIDRDVLAIPGLSTVVVFEGAEDVLNGAPPSAVTSRGYVPLLTDLAANGINIVVVGLPPCGGYAGSGATGLSGNDPCTATVDTNRVAVNDFLAGNPLSLPTDGNPSESYVETDAAVGIPNPDTGQQALDPNAARPDKANLSDAGYAAIANATLAAIGHWTLTDGGSDPTLTTAADSGTLDHSPLLPDPAGHHPLTLSGGTNWITDAQFGTVLGLDGGSGGASSAGPAVNTATSWSFSAWVKLTGTVDGTVLAQNGANTPAVTLRLAAGAWQAVLPGSDSTTPASTTTLTSSEPVTAGSWTHLVVAYDASRPFLALYVNGQPAYTTPNASWASAGTFDLGHAGPAGHLAAQLADVQAWNYYLTPLQVTALKQRVR